MDIDIAGALFNLIIQYDFTVKRAPTMPVFSKELSI